MKTKAIQMVRIMVVLALYVCCSSVVCCGISKHKVNIETSITHTQSKNCCDKASFEDIIPNQLVSFRIMQLL
jgi:hypothetical protein